MPEKKTDIKTISKPVRFAMGGSAGMGATLFVHPLDVLKNVMQVSGEKGGKRLYNSSFDAFCKIFKAQGLPGIYQGLSAGLLRQASYTTVRLGVYTSMNDMYFEKHKSAPTLMYTALSSVTAGLIGSFVGTPAELTLIRMATDASKPLEERRNYKNAFEALFRIYKEEGFTTLWRGCVPTMARAAVVNLAQLATYSKTKQALIHHKIIEESFFCFFVASMISGLVTTTCSLPIDITKTRYQNMKVINNIPEYSSPIDVVRQLFKKEGFFAFWKGYTPYYLRIGPHTVLTFLLLEQMNKAYKKFVLKLDPNQLNSSV